MAGASSSERSADPCPTENVLAAQVAGALSRDEAARIGRHLDTCESCREVMIALRARPSSDPLATTKPDVQAAFADTLDGRTPALPTTFHERYQIKRMIGSGGMGVVYEALDLNLHRVVALKVLKHQLQEAANRLVREARAMAVLSHRNVVTVYDVGVHDEQVYVAMQLVDGATLRQWVSAAPRTVSQILRVVCDAGYGLAAAHAAGLVHRDFKPDNVLVSRKGTARVTDFGLARRADLESDTAERPSHPRVEIEDASVTRSGAIIGTPAYMAPEQASSQPCDARADQFSFCVTAWEALFGARPFAGTTWSEIYANVIAGKITDPPTTTRVPRLVQRALRRGMAVDPAARFLNMPDLLEVLETGIAKPTPWKRFAAIGLGSAAIAGAAVWLLKAPAPRAPEPPPAHVEPARPSVTPIAPPGSAASVPAPSSTASAAPAAPPTATPATATPATATPATATPATATPATTPPASAPSTSTAPATHPHRHDAAIATAAPEPAPAPAPAPAGPSLVDARAQRAAIDSDLRTRSLQLADLDEPAQAALAAADAAIQGGDAPRALAQLQAAKTAIAATKIDLAFVDRKLNRLNRKLHTTGHADEMKAVYKQLQALVQAGKYRDANALIDQTAERFGADR